MTKLGKKDVPLGGSTKDEELTSHKDIQQKPQDKEETDKSSWGTEQNQLQQGKGSLQQGQVATTDSWPRDPQIQRESNRVWG